MKPIKFLMASALVGLSIFSLSACKKDPNVVIINIDGTQTTVELEGKDAIPAKPQDPVKEGWIFRGWYLDPAGETPYNFDKVLDSGSTVYAVFDEKEYNVTFVVDGVPNVVTFKWSQTPSIETPKKDGYVFKTWCLDAECNAPYTFTAPVTTGITVYAKFVEAYKVNYVVAPKMTDEEIENNTEIVETEKQTAPVKPRDPQVEGYNFEGWFLDKNFKTACNFDKVLNAGQTIYAKLVEKKYEITYKVARTDDVLSTVTCNYWSTPEQPATPDYNGEWFFGWYLDKECTNSYDFSYTLKENTVVYANFMESKEISTVEELIAIKDYPAGNYTLVNDINLGFFKWEPITKFSGTLDGNGYKLKAFTISSTSANTGFFETNNGTIKNLTLENFSFSATYTGSYAAGLLAGTNNGTIENCTLTKAAITYRNDGSATSYLGGMIGKNESAGIVKNCSVNGKVDISHSAGGTQTNTIFIGGCVGSNSGKVTDVSVKTQIVGAAYSAGYNDYGTHRNGYANLEIGGVVSRNYGELTKSYFDGSMNVVGTQGSYAATRLYLGGVALVNENGGEITESYAKGTVTETAGGYTELVIGGFIAENKWIVKNCYADTGITTATAVSGSIGGFVAINRHTISTSYAIGSITTAFTGSLGGFVANNAKNGTINGCFCSFDISSTAAKSFGVFLGSDEKGSTIVNCRYNSESTILREGEEYVSTNIIDISGLLAAELYSNENLVETLYWNLFGTSWKIDGTNAPTLLWQNA